MGVSKTSGDSNGMSSVDKYQLKKCFLIKVSNKIYFILFYFLGDSIGEYKDFLYEPNVNFFRNGTLEFLHTSKTNEGKYMCEAKNDISPGLSKVIQLKINGKIISFAFIIYMIRVCT